MKTGWPIIVLVLLASAQSACITILAKQNADLQKDNASMQHELDFCISKLASR